MMGIPEREWWKHREFDVRETIPEQFPKGRTQVSILKGLIKDVSERKCIHKKIYHCKISEHWDQKRKRKRKKSWWEKEERKH